MIIPLAQQLWTFRGRMYGAEEYFGEPEPQLGNKTWLNSILYGHYDRREETEEDTED